MIPLVPFQTDDIGIDSIHFGNGDFEEKQGFVLDHSTIKDRSAYSDPDSYCSVFWSPLGSTSDGRFQIFLIEFLTLSVAEPKIVKLFLLPTKKTNKEEPTNLPTALICTKKFSQAKNVHVLFCTFYQVSFQDFSPKSLRKQSNVQR